MSGDLERFARDYASAWSGGVPERVAAFFAASGSLSVNDGTPSIGRAAIADVALSFMSAFPDMIVTFDRLRSRPDGRVEFHWTLLGTNSGSGGGGKRVRVSGYEDWRLGDDGLVAESLGYYDAAEYEQQLKHGFDWLSRAIRIAADAHAGVRDKAQAPYILHPLRVMLRLATDEERIVGVLHDVVEDTEITIEDLRAEGFSEEVLRGIESVTKLPGEDYDAFVDRAAKDPIGRRVKMADLQDNSDLGRIANPTDHDRARSEKYRRAIERLRASGV